MRNILLTTALFFLSINFSLAQQGWYIVPNAPQTLRFDDMTAINNTLWVCELNFGFGSYIHRSLDRGDTWSLIDTIPGSDTMDVYVRSLEFLNDSIGLAGVLLGNPSAPLLYRTTNGGTSFTEVTSPAFAGADGICGMAHFGNTVIGVGIYDGQANFFKSTDAGITWTKNDLTSLAQGLVDCYMFNDSTYLLSGMATTAGQNSGTILRTSNGGTTWQQVALDTDPFGYCWKMNFLPSGRGIGSIQESTNVFLTNDFGATWTINYVGTCNLNFGGTAFINDSVGWVGDQYFNPCFYETKNGGASWTLFTFGEAVDRMIVLDSQTVVAAGSTIYKYSADSVSTSVFQPLNITAKTNQLTINPNPVNTKLTIEVEMASPSLVSIFLLDEKQKVIKQVEHSRHVKGKYSLTEDVSNLAAGNYMLYMTTFQKHIAKKFIVVR